LGARAERGLLPAKLIELLLVGLIFAGSLILVGIPLATLWLVSRVSGEYATIYLLALTGCPLTLIAWGIVLTRLNRFLTRLRGAPGTVLEASLTVSVFLAIAALAIWLTFFAESPGPRVVI
jgi:hypothetical protein